MNVRPARPEDARRIAEIHVETWRATYPGSMPQEVLDGLSVDERERNWQEWIPHPETRAFVVELDGGVVGFRERRGRAGPIARSASSTRSTWLRPARAEAPVWR